MNSARASRGQTAVDSQLSTLLFKGGRAFKNRPVDEVLEFLKSRHLDVFECPTSECRIVSDEKRLILQRVNGKIQEWPLRVTFFEKLLRWHNIPAKPLHRMDPEAVVPLLNGILGIIRAPVILRIEDGEALTITSRKYSVVSDVELLKQCKSRGLKSVTRTDFFLRSYFEDRVKVEPIAGDACGVGLNVLNSETGFMRLRVCPFILRYVCSNGAIASFDVGETASGLVHYGVSREYIQAYIDRSFKIVDEQLPRIAQFLEESVRRPVPDRKKAERSLNSILGYPRGARLLEEFGEEKELNLYDLFNYITARAQRFDPGTRLRLESYAGDLLRPEPSRSEKQQIAASS